MDRPLGAQISHLLRDRGVEVIFGIPGVHNQELYRGIEEAGLQHVLARHEQGAGLMADGYARATGRCGVAYVITGPGLSNILTPLGQAYSDSVPVLVVSSCLDETAAQRGQLHQMRDQQGAALTVCDWSETARTPHAAYQLIDRALTEFRTKRNRPKHIQVPIRLLEASAAEPPDQPKLSTILAPDPDTIKTVSGMLETARRPLFVLGGGAVPGAMLWRDLIKRLSGATFTTYAGRGIMEDVYPLDFGAFLARTSSADVIASADLVVAVGTELSEVDLWRPGLGHSAPMVRIDLDSANLASGSRSDLFLHADATPVAELLLQLMGRGRNSDWDSKDIANMRAKWRAETDAERPGIVPICDALREALPRDSMIFSDMTQFAYVAKEVWPMDRPGHWHHPYGFGTLGYALPAAIGGAIGRRMAAVSAPTVAIVGDYGFQYTMQELSVAVELKLPLPILLWDNGKLKEIEDSMRAAQIAPNAVTARNPDFVRLAGAFGAAASAPQTLAEMQQSLRAALNASGPTLIHLTPEVAGQ